MAYVFVNPGSADMDNNGSLFDGVNATGLGFEHPNRPTDNLYDDNISLDTSLHYGSVPVARLYFHQLLMRIPIRFRH